MLIVTSALAYKSKSDHKKFISSAQESCVFFEKEIRILLDYESLKFKSVDDYKSRYYSKFANRYSDEYGLGKDIACFYQYENKGIVAYLRHGTSENEVLKNDDFFVFWISTSGGNVNESKVFWKMSK